MLECLLLAVYAVCWRDDSCMCMMHVSIYLAGCLCCTVCDMSACLVYPVCMPIAVLYPDMAVG
jgi:hypothetical protein